MLNRKPTSISLAELTPGDILLFPARAESGLPWRARFGVKLLHFFQAMIFQKHGHFDTGHAAVFVGISTNNEPVIAHIVAGQLYYTALEMGVAPFWVYSPKSLVVAQNIAAVALEPFHNNIPTESIQWRFSKALRSFFTRCSRLNIDEVVLNKNYVSSSTICSKYVIEVLQTAAVKDGLFYEYFPAIDSHSTPKTLESYLYKSPQFGLYCVAPENVYHNLKVELVKHLARIHARTDSASADKHAQAQSEYSKLVDLLDGYADLKDFDKALMLATVMLPILKIKTHFSLWQATSYTDILSTMRKFGIFKRDVDNLSRRLEEKVSSPSVSIISEN